MTDESTDNAWKLCIAAELLSMGGAIHLLSSLCSAAILLYLIASITMHAPTLFIWALIVPLLVGLVQTYLALRTGFDARLFRRMADTGLGPADLAVFDRAMIELRLMPATKAGRPIEARIAGAKRLLQLQSLAMLLQIVTALGAAIYIGRFS